MPIRHIALFEFAEGTDEKLIRELLSDLDRLPGIIAEIDDWWLREDLGKRAGSFRFALVATFASMEAVERYLDHPEHQRVAGRVAAHLAGLAEHDHEV